MTDSTRAAIVTGANSGLGLECARALLATDPSWHVVLAVHDPQRGAAAEQRLGAEQRCTPCSWTWHRWRRYAVSSTIRVLACCHRYKPSSATPTHEMRRRQPVLPVVH